LDLLQGSSPNSEHAENPDNYVRNLQEKLDEIHQDVRDWIKMKSNKVKGRYDKKARDCFFEQGQKDWLYNPRRKKEKTPKLQREIRKVHMK